MVLTDDRRKALAEYCRVDDDDALLSGFFIAATGYMETAGIREPEIGSPRAHSTTCALIIWFLICTTEET